MRNVHAIKDSEGLFWDGKLFYKPTAKWKPTLRKEPIHFVRPATLRSKITAYRVLRESRPALPELYPALIEIVEKTSVMVVLPLPNERAIARARLSYDLANWLSDDLEKLVNKIGDRRFAVRLPVGKKVWRFNDSSSLLGKKTAFMDEENAMMCRMRYPKEEIIDLRCLWE